MRVRRRDDIARVAVARHLREDGALAHAVAVGAGLGAHEGEAHGPAAGERDRHRDRLAVAPVLVRDRVGRLRLARLEVRRHEDLDARLLDQPVGLGVGAADEHAAVREEDGFRVVEAVDGGVGHHGHARVDGLGWVVQDGVVVGVFGETETGHALFGAVEDQVGSVGERGHAGQDALGGL